MEDKNKTLTDESVKGLNNYEQHKDSDYSSDNQMSSALKDMPIDFFENKPVKSDGITSGIRAEMQQLEHTGRVGMLVIKQAKVAVEDASMIPDPLPLIDNLWNQGEVACCFAASNVGKSAFVVQAAVRICLQRPEMTVLYFDCELSEKQFQIRYMDKASNEQIIFPDNLYRAEINPEGVSYTGDFEGALLATLEEAAKRYDATIIIIDNLTYLCNQAEKSDAAGMLMIKLLDLKKKYGWSLLVVAHTPKIPEGTPLQLNLMAGSARLGNFFDSVFALGKVRRDEGRRYLKQLKYRAGNFTYTADCVAVYTLEKSNGWLHFEECGTDSEANLLSPLDETDRTMREAAVMAEREKGTSIRIIATKLGLSKSTVKRIIDKNKSSCSQDTDTN